MKNSFGNSCLLIALLIIIIGCSAQDSNPVAPGETDKSAKNSTHYTWGLWQFSADLNAQTLDVTPLRAGNFHLNALPFLEPPPLLNLTLESLKFTGNIIDADIGLRHPFLGLTEFTGFDVCGIFISNGSITGFGDSSLRMAGSGDTRLLNPDGYSRWWNPAEFPHGNTMSSYKDGLLGTPDSIGDYNSTLNGYKYYCDDLEPNDTLDKVTLPKRGLFSAGKKNIRHYTIDMAAGLIFNYAVDACWSFPTGGKPWVAPDDFAPEANRPEAWRAKVTEFDNTLWNDGIGLGGDLKLSIDVYDWYNAALNKVKVESPGNFTPVTSTTPVGGGAGYSTYEVEILNATPAPASIRLLISVESEAVGYGDLLPGKPVTAYFTHDAVVMSESPTGLEVISPNGGETLWMAMKHNITWKKGTTGIADVKIEWSTDNFVSDVKTIVDSTPNDESYEWKPIPVIATSTAKIRISDVLGTGSDASNGNFSIALPVWLEFQPKIIFDTTTVATWGFYEPYEPLRNYISPAILQTTNGVVYIGYYGINYGTRSTDCFVRSANGTTWHGSGGMWNSGNPNVRMDNCKVALSHHGYGWMTTAITAPGNGWYTDIARGNGGSGYYTFDGVRFSYSVPRYPELATDQAGYVFMFGDYGTSGIWWNKTNQPGLIANGTAGQTTTPAELVANGIVSKTRSWARQGQGLAFVYYTSSGEIRLAETTDAPTNTIWDSSEVVWSIGSLYTSVHTPALCADSKGRLFASWVAVKPGGDRDIIASMRIADGQPWSVPAVVASLAVDATELAISTVRFLLPTGTTEDVAVVSWNKGNEVWSAISPLDLMAFLPVQQVSEPGFVCVQQDSMCVNKTFGYLYDVIFTYSISDENWDIGGTQAKFKTP